MGSGSLRLGILRLLDDGLEPSTEGSSLDVVRHGDRTGREQAAVDEQYRVNSTDDAMNGTSG
jgi:hypothetical protein